jgi:hypothetical protein
VSITKLSGISLSKGKDWSGSTSFSFDFDSSLYDLIIDGTLEVGWVYDPDLSVRFSGNDIISKISSGLINGKGTVSQAGVERNYVFEVSLTISQTPLNNEPHLF